MPARHASFAAAEPEDAGQPAPLARRWRVLLPLPLDGAYDYLAPADNGLAPGSFVAVPLGRRTVPGVIWAESGDGGIAAERLKSVAAILDVPPMTAELRRFVDWVAAYTMAPPGAVLRMAMSVEDALEPPRRGIAVALAAAGHAALAAASASEIDLSNHNPPPSAGEGRVGGIAARAIPSQITANPGFPHLDPPPQAGEDADHNPPPRAGEGRVGAAAARAEPALTPARRRVLLALREGPPRAVAELAREAGCGSGVVRGLVDRGFLEAVEVAARPARPLPDWRLPGPRLSADQAAAAQALAGKVRNGGFAVTVLDGVTGSGKTEVYFAAIAAALERGRQVLVLLPEIALSAQFFGRFAARFGAAPVEWHSELRHAERRAAWRDVAEGRARVVVGARSALFLPFSDLGLIVVDEEHDASYKQEDGVIYQARDMAVVRGSLSAIPVALASATPALETIVNIEQGRYACLHLADRHGGATLPQVRTIDLRRDKPERQRFLAPPLVAALAETLAAGEQALLFLNRRGYAPLTLCHACGHRMQCPNCTAWLVEHRFLGRLQCHHCGHVEALPRYCPSCAAPGALAACGPGVERLAEEVAQRFPGARCSVMASDTLGGPRAAASMIEAVGRHEVDILIGTQIVAKGHHFPMLTLVGIIDADLGLAGGDLRAAERTYQLLHQVAGRAGRAERPGIVYLQTFMPDHPVIGALVGGDRDRFLAEEAAARRQHTMPPFGRLAALIIAAPDAEAADFVAGAFARAAPQMPGVEVLGPAPAPLAVLRGRHRRRFLVKARKTVALQAVLRDWLGRVKVPASIRVQVDIDPYSFL